MFEERFLEQALEELEYWKNKYAELEQVCMELVGWVKENIKGETMESEKV